jgi:thiol-disulfide isomerase/thioredoxin
MLFLHVQSKKDVSSIDKLIKQGKDVFILVYMENCGPCNATRPEWEKLETALKEQYAKNNKLVVIDVNKVHLPGIKHIGDIDGFPTLKYIGNHGKTIETYENSSVNTKDRSVSSFINWIETKGNEMVSTTPTSSAKHLYSRLVHKRTRTRKTRKTNSRKKKTRKSKRKPA